jgi:hypothetical protein
MSDEAKTGILVHMEFSETAGAMGKMTFKFLHALHLDGFLKVMFDVRPILIEVDGVETKVPWTEFFESPDHSHFVECAPGEHELSIAVGDFLGHASIGAAISRVKATVTVQPGKATKVRYIIGAGASYQLEVVPG